MILINSKIGVQFIFKKLKDLQHVPLKFKWRLIVYHIKRRLNLAYSKKAHQLNIFLTSILLKHNAFLTEEDSTSYTANFSFQNHLGFNVTLRKHPSSDCDVFNQVFEMKEYQPLVALINNNERDNHPLNIIDAGGNIGATTIYLHSFFPDANFIVVEPDTENFKILKRNVNQKGIVNCMLVKGGIWNRNVDLEIVRDFKDKNDWAVRVIESASTTELKGYSPELLMEMGNFEAIDILKIDIEGSEKQLFNDHKLASRFLSKTKYIGIEIHDEFDCRTDIEECLRENNFQFFNAGESLFAINRNLVS